MAKIIAWLILIFVVLLALRLVSMRNARVQRKAAANGNAARAASGSPGAEPMVRCIRCGVYLPRGYACATGECASPT